MTVHPRIDQLLPSFTSRDAIGNEAIQIRNRLLELGYQSAIFCGLAPTTPTSVPWHFITDYQKVTNKALNAGGKILIHHFSVGSEIPYQLLRSRAMKVTRYHNITPPQFFDRTGESGGFVATRLGYQQMPLVRMCTDKIWAVSQFNGKQLHQWGFGPWDRLPILRDYSELAQEKDNEKVVRMLSQGKKKTILFVGRIVPNKAHHDLLLLTSLYKRNIDSNIRLVLIGSHGSAYGRKDIPRLMRSFGLTYSKSQDPLTAQGVDVWMPSTVDRQSLASCYRNSDVFICMSDHEGFCVPLVEAMHFGLPVLAHDSSAISETLGEGGWLFHKQRDFIQAVAALKGILADHNFAEYFQGQARKRAEAFSKDRLFGQFDLLVKQAVESLQS